MQYVVMCMTLYGLLTYSMGQGACAGYQKQNRKEEREETDSSTKWISSETNDTVCRNDNNNNNNNIHLKKVLYEHRFKSQPILY